MAQPITPKYMADTVVLETASIAYNQYWDEVTETWKIDPNNVIITCFGQTADGGVEATLADIQLNASSLPPAGVTALQELLNYIELEMATKYS